MSRFRILALALWSPPAAALALFTLRSLLLLHGGDGASGVPAQLKFVRQALDDGAGTEMQRLFPEGYVFSHVFYGLACIDQALALPPGDPRRGTAAREARWALERVTSSEGRAPFSPALTPPYGVFHAGWSNWLRGGLLLLEGNDDSALGAELDRTSATIAHAFDASPTPFLAAYPGSAWPVDSVVAIASLQLHDVLRPARHAATIRRWRDLVRPRLDPRTGLIPHRVDPTHGQPLEHARGSSQTLLLRFLAEIDPALAAQHYDIFRRTFVTTRLGLPGVREHPDGLDAPGDVDSGPLVLGVSLSATVVARGAAAVHGDAALAGALGRTMELCGLPFTWAGAKRYAFGLLPVGDAIVAWSHGARRWTTPTPATVHPPLLSRFWTLPVTLLALVFLGVLGLATMAIARFRRAA